EGPDRSLDPATKRDIYLMLREALNNAIKYAHAKHISVRFHTSAAQVEFEVKDDGVGMDVDGSSGHGLGNMRARAERIGGSLDVRSIAGQGTRIGLRLTLSPV
ncbi:MAG: ATP-binding protein, partial [Flavobacteriales bacterium]|nr:ATP-binding protein [Flavobacteriales bacterium]